MALEADLKISRLFLLIVLAVLLVLAAFWWTRKTPRGDQTAVLNIQNGGRIVATYRSEPTSFNRYLASGVADDLIARLTHATLVRLDRRTGKVEPRLARSWEASPDGLTWTFRLEPAVVFSDGTPFTSADVVFSFRAVYDPKVASDIASSLMIDGKPMTVRAVDRNTIAIVFPAPYAPGISLLDALPILPAHKLQAALDNGTFQKSWGLSTPLNELTGLGPFVMKEYAQNRRMVFARNPRFWLRDANGGALPHLDEIELQVTPDQNAEVLRLQAGEADLITDRVRFEDFTTLQNLEKQGRITLHDAGVSISPDAVWFNLNPKSASARERPWLQKDEARLAISQAVSRTTIVNTVFLGQAVEINGPITPGHEQWFLPDLPRPSVDASGAIKRLAAIGLTDRNGDGLLDDERGKTASFSIIVSKGQTVRERTVAVIQDQLKKIGLKVDVVPVEGGALFQRFQSGDYDAICFSLETDSFDPARNPDFWMSSGPYHVWNPKQLSPATAWEGRMDQLMAEQSTTIDAAKRRELFAQAQRLLAEHAPILYFAAPKVVVATSSRMRGVVPSVLAPTVLWNAETLSVTGPSR